MKNIFLILLLIVIAYGGWIFFKSVEEEIEKDPDIEVLSAEELGDLALASNDFAFATFFELAEENENLFISPCSIHTAMLLAYMGADENTRDEMTEVLALSGMEEEEIKKKAYGLKYHLEAVSEETEVAIANSFFLREDIPFLESYKKDGETYFDAELKSLPSTGDVINDWVKEKTEEKIEEIIDPGPIPDDVIAYLVNAIYFKGIWEKEFDEDRTREETFYGEEEAEVEMMENEGDYLYGISEKMQAVTMEYKEGDYLFHAFMPTEGSLSELYEEFDEDTFEDIKPTNEGEVTVRLPKFTLEHDMKLSDALENMGIVDAFDRHNADFSRMVDLDEIEENVYIGEVYHSSFIEVDEKGTEAAAATAVEMRLESAPMEKTVLEFNRPFFFAIEEAETSSILFMGQFAGPQ